MPVFVCAVCFTRAAGNTCDYDDLRMVIQDCMSLATSTNTNVGILEKATSSLMITFVGVSNASADTGIA